MYRPFPQHRRSAPALLVVALAPLLRREPVERRHVDLDGVADVARLHAAHASANRSAAPRRRLGRAQRRGAVRDIAPATELHVWDAFGAVAADSAEA